LKGRQERIYPKYRSYQRDITFQSALIDKPFVPV